MDRLVTEALGTGFLVAQAATLVFLVLAVVAGEERPLRVAFGCQDVRGDPVQEPAVVRDDQAAAGEFQQGVFQRPQGFHVQVVGGFVQQQHVAAFQQGLGQMQAAALTPGQLSHQLLLVGALEVEAADVGARLHLELADIHDVQATRHVFPDGLVALQRFARLVHVGDMHGVADLDLATVRLLASGDHPEDSRLTGTVGADDADDGTWRDLEAEVVDQ